MPNINPNFNYAGMPNYGYPDKKNQIGLIIGSLLGAGMGAAGGRDLGDALLRGVAGGTLSYGTGLNAVQDYDTGALNQQRIADYLLYQPEQQQMEREQFQLEKEMFPVRKEYMQSQADLMRGKVEKSPEELDYLNTDRQLSLNKKRLENRLLKQDLLNQKPPKIDTAQEKLLKDIAGIDAEIGNWGKPELGETEISDSALETIEKLKKTRDKLKEIYDKRYPQPQRKLDSKEQGIINSGMSDIIRKGVQGAFAPESPQQQGITAINPQTKQRIISYDGGKNWQPLQ